MTKVIWVTSYRASEAAIKIEEDGGLFKSCLMSGGQAGYEFEKSVHSIEFLKVMIPIIRDSKSNLDRKLNMAMLMDILKWNIIEAQNMSNLIRSIRRRFAKAGHFYYSSVPKCYLKFLK